jgi:hypothetical protein
VETLEENSKLLNCSFSSESNHSHEDSSVDSMRSYEFRLDETVTNTKTAKTACNVDSTRMKSGEIMIVPVKSADSNGDDEDSSLSLTNYF